MKIGDYLIDGKNRPYIIAEISSNHGGSFRQARQLIGAAKRAGADAVKTQCYRPDSITLNINKTDFIIQSGLWQGRTLHELYTKAHTPPEWHPELYKIASDLGITIFSSVFDYSSIEMLDRMGCPAYKIASFEIVDIPLIRHAAQAGKPLIVSTGMATDAEVQEAYEAIGGDCAFLHCTSEYPGTIEASNLSRMLDLRGQLGADVPIGISDHTIGYIVPIAATAIGGSLIEKHLRLNGDSSSEDATFSLDESQFGQMVHDVKATWTAMQPSLFAANPSRQLRRSLYAVADIAEGEPFTEENVRSIRPGYGLPPKELPRLLGKRARQGYKKGDRITNSWS